MDKKSINAKTTEYKEYIMLYGTEGGGRGRKSKYMVLPRGGRVKFDFLNAPAGWPSPVWFFELTCRAAESN